MHTEKGRLLYIWKSQGRGTDKYLLDSMESLLLFRLRGKGLPFAPHFVAFYKGFAS
jgi:hypothetical protein